MHVNLENLRMKIGRIKRPIGKIRHERPAFFAEPGLVPLYLFRHSPGLPVQIFNPPRRLCLADFAEVALSGRNRSPAMERQGPMPLFILSLFANNRPKLHRKSSPCLSMQSALPSEAWTGLCIPASFLKFGRTRPLLPETSQRTHLQVNFRMKVKIGL